MIIIIYLLLCVLICFILKMIYKQRQSFCHLFQQNYFILFSINNKHLLCSKRIYSIEECKIKISLEPSPEPTQDNIINDHKEIILIILPWILFNPPHHITSPVSEYFKKEDHSPPTSILEKILGKDKLLPFILKHNKQVRKAFLSAKP